MVVGLPCLTSRGNRLRHAQGCCQALDLRHPRFGLYRRKVWRFFEEPSSSQTAKYTSWFLMSLIVLATVVLCVQTLPHLQDAGELLCLPLCCTNGLHLSYFVLLAGVCAAAVDRTWLPR